MTAPGAAAHIDTPAEPYDPVDWRWILVVVCAVLACAVLAFGELRRRA